MRSLSSSKKLAREQEALNQVAEAIRADLAKLDREHLDESRRRCNRLYAFVKEAWHILEPSTPFIEGWAIEAVCEHLEAVTDGRLRKLIINIPPGMMKSLLVSVFWPAWEWGPAGRPGLRYLSSSYEEGLAQRDSLKMRNLITSEWFQARWPITLTKKAETKFSNTNTGGRECRAFGSLTGGRGDRVMVDDPHSTQKAESEVERARAIQIFRESLPSRRNSELTAFVIVMQRLHENDVTGVALKYKLGYEHLFLPMEFEPDNRCRTSIGFADPRTYAGELLFPERFSRQEVEDMKKAMGPYAVASQFQQRPSPRDGGLFRTNMIGIVDAIPSGFRRRTRAWDLAATRERPGTDPDYTAGVKMSRGDDGRILVEDVIKDRLDAHAVRVLLKATATRDTANAGAWGIRIRIPQDPGQAGKDQAQNIVAELAGFPVEAVRPTGDKVTRAEPFSAQVAAGNVDLLNGDWNDDFLTELASFPAGAHDDVVDASSDAFNDLAGVRPGQNVADYYRAEADRIASARARQQALDAGTTEPGMVEMIPPPGTHNASGQYGDAYILGPSGTMHIREHDAPLLARVGFRRVETPEPEV